MIPIHNDLVGKLCKLNHVAFSLEIQYVQLLHVGIPYKVQQLFEIGTVFMFMNEKPTKVNETEFYCVKEIGQETNEDLHYFTLDQLNICE